MVTKFTTHIEHFNAGELSPLLRGRIDTNAKSHGFRRLENFYVIPQGGIRRREGTRFAVPTDDPTKRSKLFPYIINGEVASIVEAGNGVFRVFDLENGEDGSVDDPADSTPTGGNGGISVPAPEEEITNNDFATDLTGWTDESTSGGTAAQADGAAVLTTSTGAGALVQSLSSINPGRYLWITDAVSSSSFTAGEISLTGTGFTTIIRSHRSTTTDPIIGEIIIPSGASNMSLRMTSPVGSGEVLTVNEVSLVKVGEGVSNTSITSDELGDISVQQGPGGAFITSEFSAPGLLVRNDAGNWTYSIIPLTDGPYCDKTDPLYGGLGSGTTISTAGGAATAVITVTSSADLFVSTDVDRLIRIRPNDTSDWGYGIIDAFNSATSVDVYVDAAIAASSNTVEWRLGAWSDTTGYPRASCFHEQRIVYGGTTYQPQTIWGSYVGQHENFAPDDGSADENITALTAYTFTLATTRPELIQWLASKEALLIGTNYQIHRCAASDFNEALNARNVNVKSIIKVGSARLDPMMVQDSLIFPQLYRRQMLEMYYNSNRGRNVTRDLMVGADHIADLAPITSSAFQEFPYGLMWFGLDNGTLAGLSYRPEEGVLAWHRHILGGSLTGKEGPVVESIVTIPGKTQDDVWMIVKRTINGAVSRNIEVLTNTATTSTARSSATYLDSYTELKVVDDGGLVFNNTASHIDDLQQMTHLVGETVHIMVNDVLYGTDTVAADGTLTTYTTPADFSPALVADDIVKVGLNYTSYAETNRVEPINNLGHGPAHDSRIVELTLRLHNSLKGKAGYASSSSLDNLVYPTSIDPTDSSSLTFTGDSTLKFPHGWERDTRIVMQQTEPYPFSATLLIAKMVGGNN